MIAKLIQKLLDTIHITQFLGGPLKGVCFVVDFRIINMKQCTKCKEIKELSEFSKDSSKKDGLKYLCRTCVKIIGKKYYSDNREKVVARSKNWQSENREKANAIKKKWQSDNRDKVNAFHREYYKRPEAKVKQNARQKLTYAITKGEIIRPTHCSCCNKTNCKIEGHHHDYTKPLDVTWYCRQCHIKADQELRSELDINT